MSDELKTESLILWLHSEASGCEKLEGMGGVARKTKQAADTIESLQAEIETERNMTFKYEKLYAEAQARIAELEEKAASFEGSFNAALKDVQRLDAALEHIGDYWNRDQNEKAMADALWHIIETVEAARGQGNE